jgi:FtsH-binding integral membrane protein
MLGMISAFHSISAVLIAVGITFFISLGVTLFACQTKFDFTSSCWLLIVMLVMSLVLMGISIALCFAFNVVLQGVYGGLGAVLMALFLAIDTQLIIGNKRFRYEAEDYVNAALQLYLDICYMFMYILQLVGAAGKN